jgi:hypothetical protein
MPRLQISYESRPVISRSAKTIRPPRGRSISAMARISDDLSAVGADDGGNLAFGNFQGNIGKRLGVGVIQVETCYFEQSCHVFLFIR